MIYRLTPNRIFYKGNTGQFQVHVLNVYWIALLEKYIGKYFGDA